MEYDVFSKYYDEVTGYPEARIELIEKLIQENHPKGQDILEIGCGTGRVLEHFSTEYEVWGLDISQEMLKLAKKRIPNGKFFAGDMSDFEINESFDVILCVYDSINHLLEFEKWKKTFKNVENHLAEKGIFIMDYNTPEKLEEISKKDADLHRVDDDFLVVTTKRRKDGAEWIFHVFKKKEGKNYVLEKDRIIETSYSIQKVKKALEEHFSTIKTMNEEGDTHSDPTERVYFLCEI